MRYSKLKQSQKLLLISKESRRIRTLQREQKIDDKEANRLLLKLCQEPEEVLDLFDEDGNPKF